MTKSAVWRGCLLCLALCLGGVVGALAESSPENSALFLLAGLAGVGALVAALLNRVRSPQEPGVVDHGFPPRTEVAGDVVGCAVCFAIKRPLQPGWIIAWREGHVLHVASWEPQPAAWHAVSLCGTFCAQRWVGRTLREDVGVSVQS